MLFCDPIFDPLPTPEIAPYFDRFWALLTLVRAAPGAARRPPNIIGRGDRSEGRLNVRRDGPKSHTTQDGIGNIGVGKGLNATVSLLKCSKNQ